MNNSIKERIPLLGTVLMGGLLALIGGMLSSQSFAAAAVGGPTVTISSTSATSTSVAPIPISVMFSESVTGFATTSISATNATVTDLTGTGATYTFNLNPLSNGSVSVMIVQNAATSTASSTGSQASNTLTFNYQTASTTTATTTTPVISGISASTSDLMATISWMTDQATDAQVLYGTTTSYGASSTLNTSTSTTHSIVLSGLASSTTYHYQVLSKNSAGKLASSTDQTFTTVMATTTATTTPLAVTSVDTVNSIATADNTYVDGWKWILHLTVPDIETAFRMKFSDFVMSGSSNTISTANDVRIFSAQSSNAMAEGSAITETGNGYGGWIYLVGDTSSTTPGRQVDVTVEAKIPTGTAAGTYFTTYGAQSVPAAATSTTP